MATADKPPQKQAKRGPRSAGDKLLDKLAVEKLGKAPLPKMAEIAAEFVQLAGGPKLFAKKLWGDYIGAAEGSLVRQRIMESIVRSLKSNEDAASEDLDDLTDADMARVLEDTVRRLGATTDAAASDQPNGVPAGTEDAESEKEQEQGELQRGGTSGVDSGTAGAEARPG